MYPENYQPFILFLRKITAVPDEEIENAVAVFRPKQIEKNGFFVMAVEIPEVVGYLGEGVNPCMRPKIRGFL